LHDRSYSEPSDFLGFCRLMALESHLRNVRLFIVSERMTLSGTERSHMARPAKLSKQERADRKQQAKLALLQAECAQLQAETEELLQLMQARQTETECKSQ
jgi:hypothetical protein